MADTKNEVHYQKMKIDFLMDVANKIIQDLEESNDILKKNIVEAQELKNSTNIKLTDKEAFQYIEINPLISEQELLTKLIDQIKLYMNGCELFLSTPNKELKTSNIKVSDNNHLYLYRERDRFYYCLHSKNEKYYLDEDKEGTNVYLRGLNNSSLGLHRFLNLKDKSDLASHKLSTEKNLYLYAEKSPSKDTGKYNFYYVVESTTKKGKSILQKNNLDETYLNKNFFNGIPLKNVLENMIEQKTSYPFKIMDVNLRNAILGYLIQWGQAHKSYVVDSYTLEQLKKIDFSKEQSSYADSDFQKLYANIIAVTAKRFHTHDVNH